MKNIKILIFTLTILLASCSKTSYQLTSAEPSYMKNITLRNDTNQQDFIDSKELIKEFFTSSPQI